MPVRLIPEEGNVVSPIQPPTTWPRPSISEYGPRVVRAKRSATIATAALAVVTVLPLLIGGTIAANRHEQNQRVLREARIVAAQIIGRQVRRGDKKTYRLQYRYVAAGQTHVDWEKVSREEYETTPDGSTADVTIASSRPELHRYGRFSEVDAQKEVLFAGLAGCLWLVSFGAAIAILRAAARRETVALSDWVATTAQVLTFKPTIKNQNGGTYALRLRYPVLREAPREIDVKVQRQKKWELQPGDTVDILFNPENPTKVKVLEGLQFVEIDPGVR